MSLYNFSSTPNVPVEPQAGSSSLYSFAADPSVSSPFGQPVQTNVVPQVSPNNSYNPSQVVIEPPTPVEPSLPQSAEDKAKGQGCWSRLPLEQKKLLVGMFKAAEIAEKEIRSLSGNEHFKVTLDAHHALCEKGDSVKQAYLQQPGWTERRFNELNIDWASITKNTLSWFAEGHQQNNARSLNGYAWRSFISTCERVVGDSIGKESFNEAIDHFHISWDEPNSNDELHYVHHGKTLIYVVNDHCTRADVKSYGDLSTALLSVCSIGKPSNQPIYLDFHGSITNKPISAESVVLTRPPSMFNSSSNLSCQSQSGPLSIGNLNLNESIASPGNSLGLKPAGIGAPGAPGAGVGATSEQKAKSQQSWSRLPLEWKKWLIESYNKAEYVQNELRTILKCPDFMITIDANNAICSPDASVKASWASQPSWTIRKVEELFSAVEPDPFQLTRNTLAWMADGSNTLDGLNSYIWGAAIRGAEQIAKDSISLESFTSAVRHWHIQWDHPDSNLKMRWVHQGTRLSLIYNDHSTKWSHNSYPSIDGAFQIMAELGNPALDPRTYSPVYLRPMSSNTSEDIPA